MVVHRSVLAIASRHPTRTPPQTRVEDTVVDLTQTARNIEDAMGWLARAVGARVTTPARLIEAMNRRPRLRWRPNLASAVEDVRIGCHSLLELKYYRQVERAHGLPRGRLGRSIAAARSHGSSTMSCMRSIRRTSSLTGGLPTRTTDGGAICAAITRLSSRVGTACGTGWAMLTSTRVMRRRNWKRSFNGRWTGKPRQLSSPKLCHRMIWCDSPRYSTGNRTRSRVAACYPGVVAAARRLRAASTTAGLVVYQNGGSDFRR